MTNKRTIFRMTALAIALTAPMFSSVAHAVPVLDQSNETLQTTAFNGGTSLLYWQQTVTAGLSGLLSQVDIYFRDSTNLTQGIDFSINLGSGWQSDGDDYFEHLSLISGWNSVDVSSAGITLTAGSQFSIGLHGTGSTFEPSFSGTNEDPYVGGMLYLGWSNADGSPYGERDYDIDFRTFVDQANVETVPEPATIVLTVLGIGAMVRSARHRKS